MPRYDPHVIEPKWQRVWEAQKTFRAVARPGAPKLYVLDMFPYPSGEGLHVGHPEGYTATDMWCRYQRMRAFNVLHPMGYDAFGLPAEQYAIQTGTHPRVSTERNIANIRRQIKRLGFSYDWDREIATTDPAYVKWTQWIFLVLHDTWFDADHEWIDPVGRRRRGRGRSISELPIPDDVRAQGDAAIRRYQDAFRLAFQAEAPVNWCEALGTVLADEEVIKGRSERGDHPVVRIPLRQWLLRITAYADRLVEDLELLDWPAAIKEMQRHWVGRSEGAEVDFRTDRGVICVYTTRPDTLFGATYLVLAPEHPLVDLSSPDCIVAERWPNSTPPAWRGSPPAPTPRAAVGAYQERVAAMSEEDRVAGREKTGVFTGAYAVNPVNDERIPIWIADYVLVGYGTGAIMAVPAHDERDFEFARELELPMRAVVLPPDAWLAGARPGIDVNARRADYVARPDAWSSAFCDDGSAIQSSSHDLTLNGLLTPEAKRRITDWLEAAGQGRRAVRYRLRDWLFSRQRYWGEPFPILHELDEHGRPTGLTRTVPIDELPVRLPELEDYRPSGRPEPPLTKATAWVELERDGRRYRRETNTMPQWAGSCWYFLRFCDPANDGQAWSREAERYWMPVDLYVGGAEHAVLHLLYARFWHKVLFDRGHVSTPEPFQRLVNQGMILSITYRDASDRVVPYTKIAFTDGAPRHAETGEVLEGSTERMSKSRGNVIPVDEPIEQHGADVTRLYEMFMGPLEDTKPWSMQGVEGVSRFLARAWRLIVDEDAEAMRLVPAVSDEAPTEAQARVLHRTIKAVSDDMEALRFNTAIARLMEFVNFFTGQSRRPRRCMEAFVLMLAPLAPHIAEEMWEALGSARTLAYEPWPMHDPALTREDTVEIVVQLDGKTRSRITLPADAQAQAIEAAALADARVQQFLAGRTPRKVIVVPGKLVNLVV
jgi:leucyl-tRNA synthetase